MLSMADNYKLLHYLYSSKPDRQYPYWTPDEKTSDNEAPSPLDGTELVLSTISENYSGIDFIQLVINPHENQLNAEDFKFSFSSLPDGSLDMVSLTPDESGEIPLNQPYLISFTIDTNTKMRDKSRYLTGIRSVKISVGKDVQGLEFLDLVFKSEDYVYTLSDLENAYHDGEDYVLRTINSFQLANGESFKEDEVPKELKRYVYMAGAAFAWLEHWEYEAKPMKQTNNESNNYADRLLMQVDKAIDRYLANLKKDFDEVGLKDDRFLKFRKVSWGL